MASFQQTIIIGNVGRDPELRYTPNGAAVCDFSVAVSRRWTNRQTNQPQEETTWFRVNCWGDLAETANTYVRKGMLIMVRGTVSASAYLSQQDGQPRASLDLRAFGMQFLTSRAEMAQQAGGSAPNYDDDFAPPSDGGGANIEDIPF